VESCPVFLEFSIGLILFYSSFLHCVLNTCLPGFCVSQHCPCFTHFFVLPFSTSTSKVLSMMA
jgi:hypothetical protein